MVMFMPDGKNRWVCRIDALEVWLSETAASITVYDGAPDGPPLHKYMITFLTEFGQMPACRAFIAINLCIILRMSPRRTWDGPNDLKHWPQPAAKRFVIEPWRYSGEEKIWEPRHPHSHLNLWRTNMVFSKDADNAWACRIGTLELRLWEHSASITVLGDTPDAPPLYHMMIDFLARAVDEFPVDRNFIAAYLRNVLRIRPRSDGDEPTDLKTWPPAARRFTSEPWVYDLAEEV